MESSRRDLSNDMAEPMPILKNNQNTYHPRFGFSSETGIAFSKAGVLFFGRGEVRKGFDFVSSIRLTSVRK